MQPISSERCRTPAETNRCGTGDSTDLAERQRTL